MPNELLVQFIFIYGFINLTHFFLQLHLSQVYYLRQAAREPAIPYGPRVAVIIPTYNETYDMLRDSVRSCLNQDYKGKLLTVLVDDGSDDKSAIKQLTEEYIDCEEFIPIPCQKNQGKRHAQKVAFDHLEGQVDIFVTVDSDTVCAPDAVTNIISKFRDPKTGATTGIVLVKNDKDNILTKLIGLRYWFAFELERAAQSITGTVLCCSGPMAAYRADLIKEFKEDYVNQTFMGLKCTYGDDRHLTNLTLKRGYKVWFEPRAVVWTLAPEDVRGWLKQQLRWSKSFYREMGWTVNNIMKKDIKAIPPYVVFDMFTQGVMPILMLVVLGSMALNVINGNYLIGLLYLATMIAVAFMRVMIAYYRIGDRSFFIFPIYAFLHIGLLLPVRLYALFSLRKMGWGTR